MGAQDNPQPINMNGTHPASSVLSSRWAERAVLLDARGTVRAVEFAPHHFGLKFVRPTHMSTHNARETNHNNRHLYPPTTTCAYTNASSNPPSKFGSYPKR